MRSTMLNYFHIYVVKSRVFKDAPVTLQKGPGYGELPLPWARGHLTDIFRQTAASGELGCPICSGSL